MIRRVDHRRCQVLKPLDVVKDVAVLTHAVLNLGNGPGSTTRVRHVMESGVGDPKPVSVGRGC